MGKKIFVSYKYADTDVLAFKEGMSEFLNPTTVRDYVDRLEWYFDRTDDIYKGESDDEDLSEYDEDTIWDKLKDRIFDSSITILMISSGMKEPNRRDRSQWIPWEISYSYYLNERACNYNCSCTTYNKYATFNIVAKNMFNWKQKKRYAMC
jgi:hypothetical protein